MIDGAWEEFGFNQEKFNGSLYDGLDSSSTTLALTANQGRLLNTKITTHTSNNTIHIKQTSSDYIIEYDGNSKYQGVKLSTLLNAFTYGTRTVKGDPMLLDIFKKFEKLVLVLYNEWKEAYGY